MRLPEKKKPGDPVLAEDWNVLLDAITARTPRSGSGLKLICSSGGFAYSSPPQMVTNISHPPFSVIGIENAGTSYKVTMKEGWVIERQPKSDTHPAVKFHMPKAGDTALHSTPRPQIAMSIGSTAWCRVQTDVQGLVSGDPTIIVATGDKDGLHYYPEDPDASGQPGDYYIKLFKLVDGGGTPAVVVYQQSDIEHWAQLWTGENVGGGARVFKEHDEEANRYKFRTIKGIAPLTADGSGDAIEISADGANINWEVYETYFSHDSEGHLVATRSTTPEFIVYIRHGLVVGLVDPEDDPEDLHVIASDRNAVPGS